MYGLNFANNLFSIFSSFHYTVYFYLHADTYVNFSIGSKIIMYEEVANSQPKERIGSFRACFPPWFNLSCSDECLQHVKINP